jgi:hypothetical protein
MGSDNHVIDDDSNSNEILGTIPQLGVCVYVANGSHRDVKIATVTGFCRVLVATVERTVQTIDKSNINVSVSVPTV